MAGEAKRPAGITPPQQELRKGGIMREIKFRAWDTVKKKMFSAYEMGQDQEALLPDGRGFANISSTSTKLTQIHSHLLPLQYTGLKDKNGREIYEGDIVELAMTGFGISKKFVVEWEGNGYGTMLEDFHREVIGNIYENPELIKR